MTIRTRLIVLLLTALLGLALVAVFGYRGMLSSGASMAEVGEQRMPAVIALLDARSNFNRTLLRNLQVSVRATDNSLESRKLFADTFKGKQQARQLFDDALKRYAVFPRSEEENKLWHQFGPLLQEWQRTDKSQDELLDKLAKGVTPEEQYAIFREFYANAQVQLPVVEGMDELLRKMVEVNDRLAQTSVEQANAASRQSLHWMIAVNVFALLLLLANGTSVLAAVLRPLNRARRTVLAIAESNDFTQRIDVRNKDEVGQMVSALNNLIGRVQESFREIQQSQADIRLAVSGLSAASEQLASSSAQQNSSTGAIAGSVQEMTGNIHGVAEHADAAMQLSLEAGEVSRQGCQVIAQTTDGMASIADSVTAASKVIEQLGQESRQISSVVQVIRDIADQTNLLALNAAIEAARAGETGRGFAVVADEVRKLAERTAKSTADIGVMVTAIQNAANGAVEEMRQVVEQVGEGRALASGAGQHIAEIEGQAQRVADAVADITRILKVQGEASEAIVHHVHTISDMAKQNHATSNETADNARRLDQLAARVGETLQRYKV
ncbi:methyl-accepting chemotaxis protein [Pseudogulbenkiania ferrooxidans]|uniref:Methyl-accepting chemotaxis sensory transducer n=1 Tax=Pseudogulbenkiania ferrooxidans 2002 TaxID=279714 RepID=B9Z1B8_9NEIS|nr:methyl-accepting chemotaxis protein [Pseudogulbenkiania ferrooxidans]EEG09213.1 methyl-accepting chemotaxis sensory transducer [Pseudogulbenkiania ferrooxidans 2002]